jgi:hypothetical protein
VAKKLLQQRAVIGAEPAIPTQGNGTLPVRSRKLKVSMVKLERVRRPVQVCLDELEPKDGRRPVENWCAEQPAFAIEIDDLRHLPVQHTLVSHALVKETCNSYFEHDSNLRSQADSLLVTANDATLAITGPS